ncbi:MAG: ATP-grasp domain-containing protein [bacterium]
MSDRRVLVVGTTPDYIAHIHERYPGRALFLTDPAKRIGSTETAPDHTSEVVCHLADKGDVLNALEKHLQRTNQSLSGVACYDCEWLGLAASLAQYYDLPFPTVESVQVSRDKFLTKKRWAEYGVRCPKVELVYSGWQVIRLIEQFGGPVVLKPLTGSGSELTFQCHDKNDLGAAFRTIKDGLQSRQQSPLYASGSGHSGGSVVDQPILVEELIKGREYSADFIIADDNVSVIRVAKKLHGDALPFGTTMAYVVPAKLPAGVTCGTLTERLRNAAKALGLTRAICMVDFMVNENELVFLELTPRVGGDCLPPLIRCSCGLDTIGLALDFAEGGKCEIPPAHQSKEHIGMRFLSMRSGVLADVNYSGLSEDLRVKGIFIKYAPGHVISVPPENYDSWLLGHVIFESRTDVNHRRQCDDIRQKIIINVEQYHDQRLAGYHNASRRAAPSPNPTA